MTSYPENNSSSASQNSIINITNNFRIGDYIIDKKRIGKGAFSTIFKGYHYQSKTVVAVKKMVLNKSNKLNKNIKREIDLMKKIQHRNIIKLYDVIIDNEY